MNQPRWRVRELRDGRIVVERDCVATSIAIELLSGEGYAPTYAAIALGADLQVVAWLRAGEA